MPPASITRIGRRRITRSGTNMQRQGRADLSSPMVTSPMGGSGSADLRQEQTMTDPVPGFEVTTFLTMR